MSNGLHFLCSQGLIVTVLKLKQFKRQEKLAKEKRWTLHCKQGLVIIIILCSICFTYIYIIMASSLQQPCKAGKYYYLHIAAGREGLVLSNSNLPE